MIIDGQRSADRATSTVLGYYNAFNRGDWKGMLALLSDDVAHDINQGRTERGRNSSSTWRAATARNCATWS